MKKVIPAFLAMAPAAVLITCATARAGNPAPNSGDHPTNSVAAGRRLFLRNCAHCHGADARGEDGPDLHGLDWTDKQIASRIQNGKKGQMTAFGNKLQPSDYRSLIAYLRTLK